MEIPPPPSWPPSRQSAWMAALKSLVLPGLGQWHNGQFDKAAWWLLGFALLGIPGVAVVALWLPPGWMLPVLLALLFAALALWIGGAVDAYRTAWRIGEPRAQGSPRPLWRQQGITLLILLLCDGVAFPMLTQEVRDHAVASFRIPSASMAPSLWPGDIAFVDRRYACIGCTGSVRRGDVVVFAYPNDRTRYYVKRVVGLPGDRVQVEGERLRVNGKPVSAPEAAMPPPGALARAQVQRSVAAGAASIDQLVPPGQVFVLGDALRASVDSREFGSVPLADVVGRVRQLWWSSGPDGVRWGRLGLVVR